MKKVVDSNSEFPIFLGKDETILSKIHETRELPSNLSLRKLLGYLGILLITCGVIVLSASFSPFITGTIPIISGIIATIIGTLAIWCSVRLERCPALGTVFTFSLTNKRLILSQRPDTGTADTKRGPQLKTYQSKSLTVLLIMTLIIPLIVMVYSIYRGYLPAAFFSYVLSFIFVGTSLYFYLEQAGLILIPIAVFLLSSYGRKSIKLTLTASLATLIVYYFYFFTPWQLNLGPNIFVWATSEVLLLPIHLLISFESLMVVLAPFVLLGFLMGEIIIPYISLIGLISATGIQIGRRGAGRGGPRRGFGLPRGILGELPDGLSHFWRRIKSEVMIGGNYIERDLALNAIRNVETRSSPKSVPKGRVPILVTATFIASIAIGIGGYVAFNSVLLLISGIALIVATLVSKREISLQCSEREYSQHREQIIVDESSYCLNRALFLFILVFFIFIYIPLAVFAFPIIGFIVFLLTYRRVMGLVTSEYFYAIKLIAQCGTEINLPTISSIFSRQLNAIFQGLDIEGLIDVTTKSSVFHEIHTTTYRPSERTPLGTQRHEVRCLNYLNAFAEKTASLVASTAISFPFLVIGIFSSLGTIIFPITILLLLLTVIAIITGVAAYCTFLLGGTKFENWCVLKKDMRLEGLIPTAISRIQGAVITSGIITMLLLLFPSIQFWIIALLIAQGVGYYIIKGTLKRIYLFGRGVGVYEGDLWIERRGLTWTARTPIYSYTSVKKGKEIVTVRNFEGYDARGRYYALKNAHSVVSVTTASSRLILKTIAVAFISGVVLYIFYMISMSFGWLTLWLLFITVFLIGLVSSYSISNIISAVVPAYGFFMDGRGSFDQYLSLDTLYPDIKTCFNSIQSSAAIGRAFPERGKIVHTEVADTPIEVTHSVESPVSQMQRTDLKGQKQHKTTHPRTEGATMPSTPLYEITCEICGKNQAKYINDLDRYLCERCTQDLELLYGSKIITDD